MVLRRRSWTAPIIDVMADTDIPTEHTTVDDRLLVMMFLVALFHLIIILGVSFAASPARDAGSIRSLEVLLVSDALPESARNDEAVYLAQRTQQGAGNDPDLSRTLLPTASDASVDLPGDSDGQVTRRQLAGLAGGDTAAVTSSRATSRLRYVADAQLAAALMGDAARQQVAGTTTTLPASADDPALRLKGAARRELMVTASTRTAESSLYIDAWRQKVERVGTLNFPNQARRRAMTGNPVLEVVLTSDGRLAEVRVQRSSGFAELDQAAVDILRLAAPFEPFSRELAARHDTLRFAYEWQFVRGQMTGSTVTVAPGR